MNIKDSVLAKWSILINACKSYYIDSQPTGISDSDYDEMEQRAINEDGFFVRDYVFDTYLKGVKTKNSYIEKIKKFKAPKSMLDAIRKSIVELGTDKIYLDLKYDGSSIAVYIDPTNGVPKRVVTVGNANINDWGVDQTAKLFNFLPQRFPRGIVAIQCEALIDIERLDKSIDPEKARQKANGLINSKYCDQEVSELLTLRAYRYYTDDSEEGKKVRESDYRDVLQSFDTVRSQQDNHILFSPAQVWTLPELEGMPGFCESDRTVTDTGTFLNDGWVLYNEHGVCQRAIKYAGAGSGTEAIKTRVKSIIWNDQTCKGKDSWSANVEVEPVQVKGCTIKKPSAGSVSKLIKNNITPGAEVGIILANSTIPMVGNVFKPGNGDYMWPSCKCGYKLSSKDIYGSLLKCGNQLCSERLGRMKKVLNNTSSPKDLDLNKLLVIDRFRWENTQVSIDRLVELAVSNDSTGYYNYLRGFLKTELQIRNLDLVWMASFKAIQEHVRGK